MGNQEEESPEVLKIMDAAASFNGHRVSVDDARPYQVEKLWAGRGR